MHNHESWLAWNEISKLVQASLGLSMLAHYECFNVIMDKMDRQTASGATSTAAVELLRKADALLVDFERHLKTDPPASD